MMAKAENSYSSDKMSHVSHFKALNENQLKQPNKYR